MQWEKIATVDIPGGAQLTITIKREGVYLHLWEGQAQHEGMAGVLLDRSTAAEVGAALVNAAGETI